MNFIANFRLPQILASYYLPRNKSAVAQTAHRTKTFHVKHFCPIEPRSRTTESYCGGGAVRIGLGRGIIGRDRTGQCPEKSDDGVCVLAGDIDAELRLAHNGDGALELVDRAVVEIGRGLRDVAQARNFKDIKIGVAFRHVGAAFVGLFRARLFPVIDGDAKFLERIASDPRAIVASGTAEIDKFAQSHLFGAGQRLEISAQKSVEFRRGQQRAFVSSDGGTPILRIDGVGVAGKSLGEGGAISRNGLELAHRRCKIGIAETGRAEQAISPPDLPAIHDRRANAA